MKKIYRFNYGDYAIGENEQFYEEMAKKGWKLKNRGQHLSSFVRSEPENRLYRIELSSPGFLEDADLPEEQVELYRECGWELVTSSGRVHVFTALLGSTYPELYEDPKQQAATLKGLRREYQLSWILVLILLLFQFFLYSSVTYRSSSGWWADFTSELAFRFYEDTAFVILAAVWLFCATFDLIYGAIRTTLLYRKLKSGKPLDHAPKRTKFDHRNLRMGLSMLIVVAFMHWGAQGLSYREVPLPLESDGPYILISDIGVEGERIPSFVNGQESYLRTNRSLMATRWRTYEAVKLGSEDIWMYQTVYQLPDSEHAKKLALLQLDNAVFARDASAFTKKTHPGLDLVYHTNIEMVCVKDNYMFFIEIIGADGKYNEPVLDAIASLELN
ncbi:MAG: DUF2812 domain-containing protein [Clostridia bacterium]|nr:DUF2812 domain-containing protein [Clostridia bacterium]